MSRAKSQHPHKLCRRHGNITSNTEIYVCFIVFPVKEYFTFTRVTGLRGRGVIDEFGKSNVMLCNEWKVNFPKPNTVQDRAARALISSSSIQEQLPHSGVYYTVDVSDLNKHLALLRLCFWFRKRQNDTWRNPKLDRK